MAFGRLAARGSRSVAAAAVTIGMLIGFSNQSQASRVYDPLCDTPVLVRFAPHRSDVPSEGAEGIRRTAEAFLNHGGTLMAAIGVSAPGEDIGLRLRRAEAVRISLVSFGVDAAAIEIIESNEWWVEGLGAALPCWDKDERVVQRTPPADPERLVAFGLERSGREPQRITLPIGYLHPLYWHSAFPEPLEDWRAIAYAVLPDMLPRSSDAGRACFAGYRDPCEAAIEVSVMPSGEGRPDPVAEAMQNPSAVRDDHVPPLGTFEPLEGAGPDGVQLHLRRWEQRQGSVRHLLREVLFGVRLADGRFVTARCAPPFDAYHGDHPVMPEDGWTARLVIERMPGNCSMDLPLGAGLKAVVKFDMSQLPRWRTIAERTESLVRGWQP